MTLNLTNPPPVAFGRLIDSRDDLITTFYNCSAIGKHHPMSKVAVKITAYRRLQQSAAYLKQ
jgi:hypothetical protein